MPASGNTIAVTSVLILRSWRRLYRDSSPALKICAAKLADRFGQSARADYPDKVKTEVANAPARIAQHPLMGVANG